MFEVLFDVRKKIVAYVMTLKILKSKYSFYHSFLMDVLGHMNAYKDS